MPTDLHYLTLTEAVSAIKNGELSPVDFVKALLKRIENIDPQLKAFITVNAEDALTEARKIEGDISKGRELGILCGIPFAIKDIIDVSGSSTTANSKLLLNNLAENDATVVKNLRKAGGICIGKTITHEFAHGGPALDIPFGPARNPWSLSRVTGGSSAGSGSAVASGMVPAAIGTDTGGSIRTPAGLCGIVGLKPTYGLVSRHGVIPNSFSFDHVGPMAWTVEDCAILLQAIAGFDLNDPASANVNVPRYQDALVPDLKGVRIGVVSNFFEEDFPTKDIQRQAISNSLEVFKSLGADIKSTRLRSLQEYRDVKLVIAESETFSVHASNLSSKLNMYGADFRRRVLPACLFTAVDYVNAQRARRRMQAEINKIYENFDVLFTLGAGPAAEIEDHGLSSPWASKMLTTPFNLFGGPAISICNGFDNDGLPLSMQLAARVFDEINILRVAYAYEQATSWRKNRPFSDTNIIAPKINPKYKGVQVSELNEDIGSRSEKLAIEAGLELRGEHLAEFFEGVPYVLDIKERLEREFSYIEEPSNSLVLR